MTTRKVQNPNAKSNSGFIWALLAIVAIAAIVIGLIVYNGRAQRDEALAAKMVPTDNLQIAYSEGDNYFTLTSTGNAGSGAPTVSLFEDFSCPHCADLAEATDQQLLDKIQAGDLNVDIHPMNFLDGQGEKYQQGHSTRALAAELALVAHQDVAALWNLRAYLLGNQQSVYNKLDNNGLADKARDFQASSQAVQDIRDGAYLDLAEKIGDENLTYQNETTGQAYTPRVMRDGADLVQSSEINNWVEVAAAS
ncbi:hypothetical protein CAPI_02650 [Corynebacterium capitovis DSM 44611]|uniref:DsbA family protein n=1 Tax=Corynebacterium capitovis TaxID=131081 RepID=UPI000378F544|nr:thioredoxin domain-containing protein [Corynebacterium capitovis]WKD57100.1 hypothetical protein CAPI_02650 [Corynebacterium capitovis DSM 44611]